MPVMLLIGTEHDLRADRRPDMRMGAAAGAKPIDGNGEEI